jgi:predicted RNA-binding protein
MAERRYWLDLFTGKTWEEFLKNDAKISGFRERRKKVSQRIQVGDYLICYLTGISRFIGVLEVKSDCFVDETPLWEDAVFPIRFRVKLIYQLTPKSAIPIQNLKEKLSFFKKAGSKLSWTGLFRGSPNEFLQEDGKIIVEEIKRAAENPIDVEFDEKKYWRKPRTFETKGAIVTVPEKEEVEVSKPEVGKSPHDEMQYLLLKLGSDVGLDVWVARNDLNKEFNGVIFKDIANLRKELPRQFDEATNKTVEKIDVLWLQGDAIIGAFEIEHTTSIYSGLLRMADLISMQPNIKINLYIVAPDERRDKVFEEINRPVFAKLKPPLPKICRFIPYSELKKGIDNVRNYTKYLKPEFIEEIAESCEPDEA